MKMKVYIIWRYQPRKVQIKITNSQYQKFRILVTIISYLIYRINLHIKQIHKGKTRIITYLRIGIKKSWRQMMNWMKMRIKMCKINHFRKILKNNRYNHLVRKSKWMKILIMRISLKNWTKWYWIFEQRQCRSSLRQKEEWTIKKNRL
jgi:hypothetical protein